jgi:hypothetical protein
MHENCAGEEIMLRPSDVITGVQWEPCARCGAYHRLIKVGKLWMQPTHRCADRISEAGGGAIQ